MEICHRLEAIIATAVNPGPLLPVLQEAQEIMGYIPVPMQDVIAAGLNLPRSDIFGTMSFYSMFTWKPRGKYVIRMCQSPPCHLNGAENMLQVLQEELGLRWAKPRKTGFLPWNCPPAWGSARSPRPCRSTNWSSAT